MLCHPSCVSVILSTAFRKFRVLHTLNVILSLRRIRYSDATHGKRILRSYLPQDDMQLLAGSM